MWTAGTSPIQNDGVYKPHCCKFRVFFYTRLADLPVAAYSDGRISRSVKGFPSVSGCRFDLKLTDRWRHRESVEPTSQVPIFVAEHNIEASIVGSVAPAEVLVRLE